MSPRKNGTDVVLWMENISDGHVTNVTTFGGKIAVKKQASEYSQEIDSTEKNEECENREIGQGATQLCLAV